MGLDLGTLFVKVQADTQDADKNINNFSKNMKSTSETLTKSGKALTLGLTTPIIGAAGASIKLASDYNESLNKVQVAFGKNSKQVEDWSKTTLDKFGIASGSALDMAALFGDMGTSMGLSTDKAAGMSTKMVGLAGDLASFKNIGLEQAQTALAGIFTGETESLKGLGIVMTDTNLQAYAYSQGIKKKTADMTESEKVQLRYNYVMDKTKNAQGDFARTSDGTANSMRTAQESVKELGASFGQVLLPIITPVIQGLTNVTKWIGGLDEGTKSTIVTIAGVLAVIGPVLLIAGQITGLISAISGAMAMAKTATLAQTAAQYGLNAALLANPITWVVLAIAALVAAFVVLWNKSEAFRNFWIGLWDNIKNIASSFGSWIANLFTQEIPNKFNAFTSFLRNAFTKDWTTQFGAIGNIINAFFANVKNVFSSVQQIFSGIITFVKGVFTGDWKQAWNGVQQIFSGIFNGLTAIAKAPLNGIIGLLNMAIGGLNTLIGGLNKVGFSVPDWVPVVGGKSFNINIPKIPTVKYLAEGGILSQPTLFGMAGGTPLVGGEAGHEAVIPLSKLPEIIKSLGYIPGTGNVTTSLNIDGREFAITTAPYFQKELA